MLFILIFAFASDAAADSVVFKILLEFYIKYISLFLKLIS